MAQLAPATVTTAEVPQLGGTFPVLVLDRQGDFIDGQGVYTVAAFTPAGVTIEQNVALPES